MMNLGNKKNGKPIPGNGGVAKFIALMIIAFGILSVISVWHGFTLRSGFDPVSGSGSNPYFWQNLGYMCAILMISQAYNLKRLQNHLYWFSWLQLKKPILDERQMAVRQRVFERAYAYSIILAVVTVILIKGTLPEVVATYDPVFKDDPLSPTLIWVMVTMMVSLPSIFAAWQKDS
jgi:hypothetical protein